MPSFSAPTPDSRLPTADFLVFPIYALYPLPLVHRRSRNTLPFFASLAPSRFNILPFSVNSVPSVRDRF